MQLCFRVQPSGKPVKMTLSRKLENLKASLSQSSCYGGGLTITPVMPSIPKAPPAPATYDVCEYVNIVCNVCYDEIYGVEKFLGHLKAAHNHDGVEECPICEDPNVPNLMEHVSGTMQQLSFARLYFLNTFFRGDFCFTTLRLDSVTDDPKCSPQLADFSNVRGNVI